LKAINRIYSIVVACLSLILSGCGGMHITVHFGLYFFKKRSHRKLVNIYGGMYLHSTQRFRTDELNGIVKFKQNCTWNKQINICV